MKKIFGIVGAILAISAILFFGSRLMKNKGSTGPTHLAVQGTLVLEKSVQAVEANIEMGGGKVIVTEADSPIVGLEVDVLANSYKESRDFKISYSPIASHTFGEDFTPLTPLISVDNGGGYSDELMEVRIPVKVPADSFAMGFIYDGATKKLEGLPMIAQDENSITIATRHFTDFVISMIPFTKLKKDIDTGFRPGMDDWQFVNRGSYIAPGGHCAGQSLSSLWYYTEQPDGKDLALYNRYDNNGDKPETPDLWEDDSLGYRFASTIQQDIDWNGFAFKLWRAQRGVSDDLTWKLFSYSMQITGEPQLVGLTKVGGHAMVAYRVKDGELFIADPNYPGDLTRRITFAAGKIDPYESGANFEEIKKGNSTRYDKVGFTGKTTIINWKDIAARWTEFKNKSIGRDRFPAYVMIQTDKDGKESSASDGMTSSAKLININASSQQADGIFTNVYRDEKLLARDAAGNIALVPGNNKLGFAIYGIADGDPSYIDFKYLNVVFEAGPNKLSIDPYTVQCVADVPCTFTASIPDASKIKEYVWSITGREMQRGDSPSFTHTFPKSEYHNITGRAVSVRAYDKDGNVIGEIAGSRATGIASFVY
ncbi:MAG: hypothetical protein WCJ29_04550 [bacterium]